MCRSIFPQYGLVFVQYFGDVIVEENVDCFLGLIRDPAFDPEFHVLVDQEACTLSEATFMEMRRLAYLLRPYYQARSARSRTAFYAPGDIHFGISRLYDTVTEAYIERQASVCRNKQEALAYLGFNPMDRAIYATIWPGALPETPSAQG